MSQDNQSLATLIGSRICHDLISPVGAIQNGIELLAMEGRKSPEITLIEDSVSNASARIRFMRVAFGMAGGGQSIGQAEIVSILDDMGRAGRLRYDWAGGDGCPRGQLQEIFLAFLCLESAMPRGGMVRAERQGDDWRVSGPADKTRPEARHWTVLCGGEAEGTILPAHVQFPLLASLLKDRNAQARVEEEGETVVIRLPA